MTLKSFIYRISCGFTNYSWGLAHALVLFSGMHPSETAVYAALINCQDFEFSCSMQRYERLVLKQLIVFLRMLIIPNGLLNE